MEQTGLERVNTPDGNTMSHRGIAVCATLLLALGAGPASPGPAQDKKADKDKAYDLTWKLPHDKAAVYEVYDLARGNKTGEMSLLGCEVESGIRPNDGTDLGFRYLLWVPNLKAVKIKTPWKNTQDEFVQSAATLTSPYQVKSEYVLALVKSQSLKKSLKAVGFQKGNGRLKGKAEVVEVAVVLGKHALTKLRWVNGKLAGRDNYKADAVLSTRAVIRVSDGAILGGEYSYVGTREVYDTMGSAANHPKVKDSRALVLTQPLVELSDVGLKTRIDKAVTTGIKWLKSQQGRNGNLSDKRGYPIGTKQGVGATALALMAMVHAGVPRDDPHIVRGFRYISAQRTNQSYDLALTLMAIETKYLTLEMIRDVVEFEEKDARREIAKRISDDDKALAKELARQLMTLQQKSGSFAYVVNGGEANLSSTQYALLGLKSASRMGVKIPAAVWIRSLNAVVQSGRSTVGGAGGAAEL